MDAFESRLAALESEVAKLGLQEPEPESDEPDDV